MKNYKVNQKFEDRLIEFAGQIIGFTKDIPNDIAGKHLCSQIIRAANSAALNYGEARGSQSDKDFVYKTSLVLKELNEVHVSLKILLQIKHGNFEIINSLIKECQELRAISITMIKNKNLIK